MQKANNRSFISTLKNPKLLLDYFNGKIRFELNLNSKEQLRQTLNIADTSISSVLNSPATPIWDFMDSVIVNDNIGASCSNLTEFKNHLVLEHCGNDLAKVETLLRNYCSPNTHISQIMKPFRVLVAKLANNPAPTLKEQLRNLLIEFTILIGIFV